MSDMWKTNWVACILSDSWRKFQSNKTVAEVTPVLIWLHDSGWNPRN